MSTNLEKLKNDLNKLIKKGVGLQLDMLQSHRQITEEEANKGDIKPLDFHHNYQSWYSESREVISQLLPNRLDDFIAIHKPKPNRKSADFENYTISDYLIGLRTTRGIDTLVDPKAAIPKFQQQLLILVSARERFDSSLFDIKQILQADLLDSEIEVAKHLNKNGFGRAAGAVAGVVVESHLQQVCDNHKIKITKKNPTINDLAQALKDNSVIDTPEWRKIQHLADLRNLCDHKKAKDPTKEQINELIDGTSKLIKTVF